MTKRGPRDPLAKFYGPSGYVAPVTTAALGHCTVNRKEGHISSIQLSVRFPLTDEGDAQATVFMDAVNGAIRGNQSE